MPLQEWRRRRGKKTPRNFSATPPLTKWCEYTKNNNAHQMSLLERHNKTIRKKFYSKKFGWMIVQSFFVCVLKMNECMHVVCCEYTVCCWCVVVHPLLALYQYVFFFQNEQSLKVFFFVGQSKNNSTSNHAQFIYC